MYKSLMPHSSRSAAGFPPFPPEDVSEEPAQTPPAAVLLKKAAGIKSGSGKPNKDKVGKISRAQLQEIAQTKAADMTGADIEAMTRSIEGTARSMGLVVED